MSTFKVLKEKKPLDKTLNVSFYGLSAGGVHIHKWVSQNKKRMMQDPSDARWSNGERLLMEKQTLKECSKLSSPIEAYLFPVFMYDGMPPRAVSPSKRLQVQLMNTQSLLFRSASVWLDTGATLEKQSEIKEMF